jgi:hypothetical protein
MPYLFVCGAAFMLAIPALLATRLFTEFPAAVGLSLLAIVALATGKVFGAACFSYAGQWWVRAGGLVLAMLCAAATAVPYWSILAQQAAEIETAWLYLAVKAVLGITTIEVAGIGLVHCAGDEARPRPTTGEPRNSSPPRRNRSRRLRLVVGGRP